MILAAISDYFDLNKLMGMLPNHSEHGKEIDHMLNFCHWFMLLLFVGWSTFFLYTIFRFHKSRNPRANYHGVQSHVTTHLEAGVVIIEAVILLGFALPLWGKRVNEIPVGEQADALKVRAMGYQFGWYFHYAGQDGLFGRQHLRFATGPNPLGLDPTDTDGADDVVVNSLVEPMHLINHKATVVRVSSRDVIHGFALHAMRIQQDAIPGTEVPQWFRPVSTGEWQIVCAQLCGSGHSGMAAKYVVEEQKDFDEWYKAQLENTQSVLKRQAEEIAKQPAGPNPAVHESKKEH
jgi:cytochrome c oxidase subunit 2